MHTVWRWSTIGAIVLSTLLLCQSCSKEASFEPLYDLNPGERLRSDTLLAETSDWFNRGESAGPGWSSTRMAVGNWNGYDSRCFLRFTAFPDTEVTVDRVLLYLWRTRTDGNVGEVVLDVHALVDTLIQTEIYWNDMPGISEEPVASFVVPPDTDSVFVDVTEAVTSWIKQEASNFGFALKAPDEAGPEFLVEFATRETSIKTINDSTSLDFRPALRIAYTDTAGENQLAVSIASEDVFADTLLTPFPEDPDHILCGRGFPSRAFVWFDVLQIPEGCTVTRSMMSLVIDPEASSFDSIGIACHAIVDSMPPWLPGFDTPIGVSGTGTVTIEAHTVEAGSTIVDFDITALVQPLVARQEANSGFAVRASNEVFDLDFMRFWSHTQPDPGLRPRLVVDYILPPALPYSEVPEP